MTQPEPGERLREALGRARTCSPYLRQLDQRFPSVSAAIEAGSIEAALAAAAAEGAVPEVEASVRLERNAFALVLAAADLAGLFDLERVTRELSELADRCLARALTAAFDERVPGAAPRGFAVVALGKLGSRELNFSSDVDLVLVYDPATLPCRPREQSDQSALRLAQRMVDLLQKRTGDGFAFRVDLRLRPSPEVTPIALPVDAAISYYESSALPWERAAFIRARQVAGDSAVGGYFLDAIQPFVWRRSLDFGAIEEIQSISRRIRDHYQQSQRFGAGYDLKRGRGGIREAEFFVQIHQLIHGGREPALRCPATLDATCALARAGRVSEADAGALAGAYRLLRTVEHRLQMIEDRQTHILPVDPAALNQVARLHGLADGATLLRLIHPDQQRVAELYGTLERGRGRRLPQDAASLESVLAVAGFPDPLAARARIEGWRSGKPRAIRSAAAREAFEAMLPSLVDAFADAPDPLAAVTRFENLIDRLPTGVNFFRLIEARPSLGRHLVAILSHAPVLADQLGRRPEFLDGLLDASAFDAVGPVEALVEDFQLGAKGKDYQSLLDCVRRRVNERRFALGVQLIAGASDPIEVAEGNSRVAEAAIETLGRGAIAEFAAQHGRVEGSELLVLGLGRLGGEALTFASDLDLIYLFTGTIENESNGAKRLRATDYFNRLAPRLTAALSVPTAAGPLYDVDTRLRPNGTDGMLAVSLDSFADYQRSQAWTWEHMALLRARPVFGSEGGRAQLAAVIEEVLSRPRDDDPLTGDVIRMRCEIAAHKPAAGPFDIKHGPGGLIDLEFSVHLLQLRHRIGLHPRLELALADLADAGLVGDEIDPALRLLTRILVMIRLVSPRSAEPSAASRPLVARACGFADWDDLLAAHRDARQSVSALWRTVTGGKADVD